MSLESLRREIDEIDEKVVSLLHRRAVISGEVGSIKLKGGLPIADRDRETAILRKVMTPSYSPIDPAVILRIYGEILLESRRIQQESATASLTGEVA